LDVGGAIAAAACAVDVAGDRHTGAAVVRVALLAVRQSGGSGSAISATPRKAGEHTDLRF
jgi:hypothetical protein